MSDQPAPEVDAIERKQALRLQRLGIAVAVYASCALLLYLVERLGFLPPGFSLTWASLFAGANLLFFLLIRTKLNLRFADPSLTMAQMSVAIGAVALILYYAQAARGALLMFLPVIVVFGVLQLNTLQLLVMGALSALTYALVILLLALNHPQSIDLRVESVQWIALTATLAVLCPLVGYLSGVRRRLAVSLRTIREMAQRDALTGIFNRHHLADTLEREIGLCERSAPACLALMVDIDHFKRINDMHGHLVGDDVLRLVAQGIRAALRKSDYVARYGGEEFAVLLSAADPAASPAACERIRAHIAQLVVPQIDGRQVTVSIGGAIYRRGDTPSTLLERADAALYRAKGRGRNCVELDFSTAAHSAEAPAPATHP